MESKIQVLRKMYFEIREYRYYANQMQVRGGPTLGFFGWSPSENSSRDHCSNKGTESKF